MRVMPTALGGLLLLLCSGTLQSDARGTAAGDRAAASAEDWHRVKLAVARNSVPFSAPGFFQSLRLRALEPTVPEPLRGFPSTHLTVGGDLLGTIVPLGRPALLYVAVRGFASSASLAPVEQLGYTELNIVAGSSDTGSGIRAVAGRRNGFIAVTGPRAGTR